MSYVILYTYIIITSIDTIIFIVFLLFIIISTVSYISTVSLHVIVFYIETAVLVTRKLSVVYFFMIINTGWAERNHFLLFLFLLFLVL